MSRADWALAAILLALAALLAPPSAPAASGAGVSVSVAKDLQRSVRRDADAADLVYPVAVLRGAGWEPKQLLEAFQEVEAIFEQCGVTVAAGPVYWLDVPKSYLVLSDDMQARLLDVLPPGRPTVVLVANTTQGDTAYAYLDSAPVASRGTVWVTRNSHPICLGPLLAHELGHILLDVAAHSEDRENLMSHTCAYSNINGFRAATALTGTQCELIRSRQP